MTFESAVIAITGIKVWRLVTIETVKALLGDFD